MWVNKYYHFRDTMLVEQLEHMGVLQADCTCDKIVFSEQFFVFVGLTFIFTMIGILVILYFWGAIFFVDDWPVEIHSKSRENSKEVSQ